MASATPLGTSFENDKNRRAILNQVNALAWLLDNSIMLPIINYRIGLDALIGLIPGLGDIATAIVSSFIILQAVRLGVPRNIIIQMVTNVAIEATVGIIPILGDIFDATYKANARNVRILNRIIDPNQIGKFNNSAMEKGIIAIILGALFGFILIIGAVGVSVFSWVMSLFR